MFGFLLCGVVSLSGQPQSTGSLCRVRLSVPKGVSHRLAEGVASSLPSVIFWAWERPEDLSFLDPEKTGVAFLAETIYLQPPQPRSSDNRQPHMSVRPRLQPLHVSPGTVLVAVVRIENSSALLPDASLQAEIAGQISTLQNLPGVSAVQIDFDATSSERSFYSALLQEVRRQLPSSIPLSITALGSWCLGDPWLRRLPPGTIDEAVPMLFRMGPDASSISRFFRSGDDFSVSACRGSLGLSTDEPLSQNLLANTLAPDSRLSREKRIYIFSPRPWTEDAGKTVLQELKPWHIE